MQQVVLKAEIRAASKGSAHRVRAEGYVPAVIYGKHTENVTVQIPQRDVTRALTTGGGRSSLFRVELNDGQVHTCLIKELQNDPLTGRARHIDLMAVSLKERIRTSVPLAIRGDEAIEKAGNVIQHGERAVEVECLPTEIPDHITIDVSKMNVGDHLTAGELKLPEGVELLSDPAEVLIAILAPKRAEAEETAEAGAAEPELVNNKAKDDEEKEKK